MERYPRMGFIAPEPWPVPRPVADAAAEVRRLLGVADSGSGGRAAGAGRPVPAHAR